ncbi:bifunctional peptidase and arginyl-hydroxylase JMJD5-like [Gigantopelta aegis]|uniref:bifunctional peptidase and arginyl-hydroxylase JMJD5-like n=1 Tax=Gigantopelta aegis TaxID=1735272 RepID=UPI001B88C0D0|nr:bifunctional peptidase and arginyl-hydroxylase JMJD5-like [Gigantopelta aegis]
MYLLARMFPLTLLLLLCFHKQAFTVDISDDTPTPDGDIPKKVTVKKTEPLCSYPPLHGISVMDNFPTPEYFYEWFVLPGQPVLFKSVLDKMDSPAYKKWTDDYLRKTYGSSKVTVEKGKKEVRRVDGVRQQTLAEFLSSYHDQDVYMIQNVKDKMKDEIPVPKCLLCGGMQRRLERHIMWFSGGGTRSVLHLDTYHNINCLLDGRKQLIFIDKKHQDKVESEGFVADRGYSEVNVDDVDYDTFPQFKNIPWINATMEKGDCLFIPRSWYHQVNSYGSRNLAVNIWWIHVPWFNTTDCVKAAGMPRPTMLSSYPRAPYEERIRLYLFDPFVDMSEVNKRTFLDTYFSSESTLGDGAVANDPKSDKEQQRIAHRIEKMFEFMDTDNNKVLNWDEIMTFNITSLLVNYGDMFPFDPNDVLFEDKLLEEDVIEAYTEEPKPSAKTTVSHDEF